MKIRRMSSLLAAAVAALSVTAAPGSATAVNQSADAAAARLEAARSRPEYVIQDGDALGIKFFLNPELNEEVVVRPDGRISLQLIPEVVAAGRTPRELAEHLEQLYSSELDRPSVSVIVRSFSSQRIYVDGEVNQPGELELVGSLTVLQAIARAEGFTDTARVRQLIVIRRGDDGRPRTIPIDIRGLRHGRGHDLSLQPFDVVYVPRTRIANVNRWIDQYVRQNIPVSFGFRIDIVD